MGAVRRLIGIGLAATAVAAAGLMPGLPASAAQVAGPAANGTYLARGTRSRSALCRPKRRCHRRTMGAPTSSSVTRRTQIRDVAHYDGPLVALTSYSIRYKNPPGPGEVAIGLIDKVIAQVTENFGGKVADGFAAFEAGSAGFGGEACAAGLLIKLPDGTCDIHPSPAGHLLLAQAIEDVVGTLPAK